MNNRRNWTVLLIGGASGTGKSTLAYEIAKFFKVNVLEVDDIEKIIKATSPKELFPFLNYWDTGIDWENIGVDGNINWLINVSKEIIPALKAIVQRHIEDNVPIIIEGDFINPEYTNSFNNNCVRNIFVIENDQNQIIQNYFQREGGELQNYRAKISVEYGKWIKNECEKMEIQCFEPRPWNTQLERIIKLLE